MAATPYRPSKDDEAYDTKSRRAVKVRTDPGTYGTDHVWVKPVNGGRGWLAACKDLHPSAELRE
ncbi:hypothetical protein SSP35_27_00270 [Streptomyces sp. NBRC 110611]|nr:hypothetical protein SSP35_27_00270 [Streptomyces sp. NBRC 110611]